MARVTAVLCDEIHQFLLTKANRRGLLEMDQKALAAEFGMDHIRFHRMVARLVDDGRLKQIGTGGRGAKIVIVNPVGVLA